MTSPGIIKAISVHNLDLPYEALGSRWLGREKPGSLPSTVVIIETESGLSGVGESCPIGAIYLPAFARGLRAALGLLAPALIGQDAFQINQINRVMQQTLFGHSYAKSAIDIACWDLLGKHCAQPVSALLGGRFQKKLPLYASVPIADKAKMVQTLQARQQQGYSRFQIKLGEDAALDIERLEALMPKRRDGDLFMVDANRGWSKTDAMRMLPSINAADCYLEQPCDSYRDCLSVRRHCQRPFILDEGIDGPGELARALGDDALDGLVIKLGHAGGLSQARIQRDMCLAAGVKMRIEDTAGSEIVRAAQAQLAAATPPQQLLGCYSFVSERAAVADGAPEIHAGRLHLNDEPGLGIELDMEQLWPPVEVYA